jgi:hypothetical protein
MSIRSAWGRGTGADRGWRGQQPAGTTAMRVRDRLAGLWADEDFARWYSGTGGRGSRLPS